MRVSVQEAQFVNSIDRYRVSNGTRVDGNTSTTTVKVKDLSRSDVVLNPVGVDGWRRPSDYVVDSVDVVTYKNESEVKNSTYRWELTHHAALGILSPRQIQSALPGYFEYAQAEVKAMNNLADRKASLAESVAELKSTAQGLAQNAKKLDRFLFHVMNRRYASAAAALGLDPASRRTSKAVRRAKAQTMSVSSAWLEFWFGISPIVSDMVALAAFMSGDSIHQKLRVKGMGRFTDKTVVTGSSSFGSPITRNVTWQAEVERSAFVSLTGQISAPQLRKLAVYGAADVSQALWARKPHTFLIDWVIPVSEVLRAQSAGVGITFRGGTRTLRVLSNAVTRPSRLTASSTIYTQISNQDSPGIVRQLILRRSTYETWPKPMTLWIKDPFGLWKTITSLALLGSKLKG